MLISGLSLDDVPPKANGSSQSLFDQGALLPLQPGAGSALPTQVSSGHAWVGSDDQELFGQIAANVKDVLWIYEPEFVRFLYASPAYEREWMRSAAALYADPGEWLRPVHPDERPLLQSAFERLSVDCGYSLEYRVTLQSGEERWIAERAFPAAAKNGRTPRVAGISQDITARKHAEMELRHSSRRKDEFLATLAHELRNPLQPIRSATALLKQAHAGNSGPLRQAILVIERQMTHLSQLTDDLLDIQRVTHGKMRLQVKLISIKDVINTAIDMIRPLAESKRVHLRLQSASSDVLVPGDSVRLIQVFCNLLHNAVKFSNFDGAVEIHVRPEARDSKVAISVRDEGAGIASELLDSVFDLFTQERSSRTQVDGGLGIGLAVVRHLTELHGGTVSAHSGGHSKGSEFIVELPTALTEQRH